MATQLYPDFDTACHRFDVSGKVIAYEGGLLVELDKRIDHTTIVKLLYIFLTRTNAWPAMAFQNHSG